MAYSVNTRPHFEHDCDACRYIASLTNNREVFDVYLHGDTQTGTVIARTGSEGPEYHSAPLELAPNMGDLLSRATALIRVLA